MMESAAQAAPGLRAVEFYSGIGGEKMRAVVWGLRAMSTYTGEPIAEEG